MKVTNLKVGDVVYSPFWSLKIKDIEEYVILDIKEDAIVLPDKAYKHNVCVVKLSKLDKKLSCFFTTYEKAVESIGHNIRKGQRHFERLGDKERLQRYLDLEIQFLEDRAKKGV